MKNAEAIEYIKKNCYGEWCEDDWREAMDMAIEALKGSERTAETAQNVQDEDLISRKAAIDALARMMPRSYTPDGSHPADEEIFRAQEIFVDCIEALEILPSAQPEKRWIPCSKRMPNNYDYQLLTEEVHYTTGKIVRGVLIAYYDDEDDVWMSAEESPEAISYPIAWQPLPEPYRGGDT